MIAQAPIATLQKLTLSSKLGLVSVPEVDLSPVLERREPAFDRSEAVELLKTLGQDLGMTLLVPKGEAFLAEGASESAESDFFFADEAIRKTVDALDVVWAQGNEIVACFVLETGTGSWDGVRRVADLLALNPKIKSAFYALTLPALKAGLLGEIHRPAYSFLKKPFYQVLHILDWQRLQTEVMQLGERARYLKPEFLEGISDLPEVPVGD
jgi:hypothetical protein